VFVQSELTDSKAFSLPRCSLWRRTLTVMAHLARVLTVSVAASNVVMPRRPATAMDHVIKENVAQPSAIRPKPLPVTSAAADQVGCCLTVLVARIYN